MRSPLSVGTFEATHETIAELCRCHGAPAVLDVGSGGGELLVSLAPLISRGLGLDISEEAIREARLRAEGVPHLSFRAAAAERIPHLDLGLFDLVLFIGSLEHMRDPRAALDAVSSCVRREGCVAVVAVPPGAPHAVISRRMLARGPNPVVAHPGVEGIREAGERSGFRVDGIRPLYRGSRRGRLSKAVAPLLSAYDRLGGATRLVLLRRRTSTVPGGPGRLQLPVA